MRLTLISNLRAVVFVLIAVRYQPILAVRWLSLATQSSAVELRGGRDVVCNSLRGLVKQQRVICKRNVDVMTSIRTGAMNAIDECQHQFRHRRWNCSTFDDKSIFGKTLNAGTREAAFVHALSSAAVSHSVTRSCASGALPRCGCDKTLNNAVGGSHQSTAAGAPAGGAGFTWSGCSDNIAYGTAFARLFVDAREKTATSESDATAKIALMNLHNNNVGRKTVPELMRVQCKCHGVSGSCELRTCWQALPSFRDVGVILLHRYDHAVRVEYRRVGSKRRELLPLRVNAPTTTSAYSSRLNDVIVRDDVITSQQPIKSDLNLFYLDESPDFCESIPGLGWPGTRGRQCDRRSPGMSGCELLCCGRGFDSFHKTLSERCQCKFHWCCEVKCNKCDVYVDQYTCK